MSCADPDILALRAEAEALRQRAGALRLSAAHSDDRSAWRRESSEAEALAAKADALTAKAARAEAAYKRDIRTLATGCAKVFGGEIDPAAAIDDLVSRHTQGRTTSRAETRASERSAMLRELRDRGFQRPGPARAVRRGPAGVAGPKAALAAKIQALLLDSGRNDAYANAIARRRWGVARWEWLEFATMEALMQMLIIDQVRRAMGRVLAALAAGQPWRAGLTPGELANGVDDQVLVTARRRGLVKSGVDARGAQEIALSERGRAWLAAQETKAC